MQKENKTTIIVDNSLLNQIQAKLGETKEYGEYMIIKRKLCGMVKQRLKNNVCINDDEMISVSMQVDKLMNRLCEMLKNSKQ